VERHVYPRTADPGGRAFFLKIWKNKIFWHKIVIFHTKYPNIFRATLRSIQFFKICPPPNSWFRPWTIYVFERNNTKYIAQRTVNFSRFHNPSAEDTWKATFWVHVYKQIHISNQRLSTGIPPPPNLKSWIRPWTI
jgi:hypothetical protein